MKCRDVAGWFVDTESASYPDQVRDHLEDCAACRQFLAGQRFAYQMLVLKRHERPDPAVEDRSCEDIRRKLYAVESCGAARFRRPDIKWVALPLLQTAAAVAIIVVAGSFFFRANEPEMANVQAIRPAKPNASYDLPLIGNPAPEWFDIATNTTPAKIQYGPLRSRLVDYQPSSVGKKQ